MLNSCGTVENGKILIVKCAKNYGVDESTSVVPFKLMQKLPAKYIPSDISEVKYLVVLSYSYEDVASYLGASTRGLRECGSVIVYELPSKKVTYDSGIIQGNEPPYSFFSSQDEIPEFVAGNRPELGEKLYAALMSIM